MTPTTTYQNSNVVLGEPVQFQTGGKTCVVVAIAPDGSFICRNGRKINLELVPKGKEFEDIWDLRSEVMASKNNGHGIRPAQSFANARRIINC